ncbi:ABC transporter substrate-binding protein [Roseomonas elaeocarpi]|uniref:ABC transporter substrate-binding protein n=1 Tax=Roseomonas elaeocarpi TaxID=907779 RepID=A0ABV6JY02_9PROT
MRDVLGRSVTIARPPRAVLLAEGFQLLALAVAHPDPVPLLVGRGGDLRRLDAALDNGFRQRFPALAKVPEITSAVGQGFSLERALSLLPDLVILSAWQMNAAEMRGNVEQLDKAGIRVVVADTFLRPLDELVPSVRLLGQVFGQEARAEAFAGFHEARRQAVLDRLRAAPAAEAPAALLTAFPGRWNCCWVAGRDGAGEALTLLGARNVGLPFLPGPSGAQLSLEQVLTAAPDIFIGTGARLDDQGGSGGGDSGGGEGLQLGTGVGAAEARDSLRHLLEQPGYRSLPEAARRRACGLWNPVFGSPVAIAAIEAMARWLHPTLFADLDPAATLAEINRRFTPVPFDGTYWTELPAG